MYENNEKLSEMSKALMDHQLTMTNHVLQHSAEKISQLAELNLQATRLNVEDVASLAREIIDAKSPQEALQLMMLHLQPNAEKFFSLSQQLIMMMANTQSELNKLMDEHMADISKKSMDLIDDLGKQSPPGSAAAIAAMKTAILSAQTGYEQATRSARAAAQVIDDKFSHLSGHYSPEVKAQGKKKTAR